MDIKRKQQRDKAKQRNAAASDARGSGGAQAPMRRALRDKGYNEGRALVSPRTQDIRAASGVSAHADHVGVHLGAAARADASLKHEPSGLGASASAEDAKLHHADVFGADVGVGRGGLNAHADHVSWLNAGASKASASLSSDRTGHRAGAAATDLAIHETHVRGADLHLGRRGLDARADQVAFTNVSADQVDLHAKSDSGRSAQASAQGLRVHDTGVDGASLRADSQGARAHADEVRFENLAADRVDLGVQGQRGGAHASATDLSVHNTRVNDADWSVGRRGMDARAGSVDFVNTRAAQVSGGVETAGGSRAQASADNLAVHDLGVRDAALHLGSGGLQAEAAEVNWRNTGLRNGQASWSGSDGAHGAASVDALSAHELAVRDGRFALGAHGVAASGGVDYTHARLDGLNAQHQTAGGTTLSAGVDHATVGAVSADEVALQTNLVRGQASVRGGRVVGHDLQGARLGLGRADEGGAHQPLLGAQADLHASHSVAQAEASWDLARGQAGASVSGYTHDRSLTNATLNVLGEQIEIPDLALHVEADAHAEVDLSDGELDLGLDLSGTEIQIGDLKLSLPEQAQLGVDVDLSEGEFNLNVGGHEIDVDGAVSKFWGKLKGLFGDGKAEKADPKAIAEGREALRGLRQTLPSLKADVRNATALARQQRGGVLPHGATSAGRARA